MSVAARHRKLVRAARSLGRGLLMTVMAAIVVLGVLRAGSRYFYCNAMGTVFASPCCDRSAHGNADGAQLEVRADDCCKARSLDNLPAAAIQFLPLTPPAPFVAVLQPVAGAPFNGSVPLSAIRANPTGPPRLSPSSHRTRLMVFLI